MNGHRCPPPLFCPSPTPPFSSTLGHSWRRTLFNYRLHKIADAAAVVEPQRKKSINCRLWAWVSRVMVYNRFKQRHYGDLSLPLCYLYLSFTLSLSFYLSLCPSKLLARRWQIDFDSNTSLRLPELLVKLERAMHYLLELISRKYL